MTVHPRLSDPTANEPKQLTLEQLRYLQTRLQTAWFKVVNDELTAQQYIPYKVWADSACSYYFHDERYYISQCLSEITRQIANLTNQHLEVTD